MFDRQLHVPLVHSETVDESAAAVPEHAAEDALQHLVQLQVVHRLRRRAGVQHRPTASGDCQYSFT